MRTLLFTGYNQAYAPLAELTTPLMQAYANKHGFEFMWYPDSFLKIPNSIYWVGVAGALHGLKECDRVIYLDVDQMITNPEFEVGLPGFGFHVSQDWGADAVEPWHFSMCGFVAHRDCVPLFEECLAMEPEWRDKPFAEQGPMRDVIRRKTEGLKLVDRKPGEPDGAFINIHPRRKFNAVPDEVCPGQVPEPWAAGDFACHLTMLPIEKRIELFHEIKKQAGI
jgi:hypothetical protein